MSRARIALIHGVGLDGSMWGPLREFLEPEYHVQILELLGHGHRGTAAPEGVTLAELAADVADRLEPGTHVVGFSLALSLPSTWPGSGLTWWPPWFPSGQYVTVQRRSVPR